MATYDAPHAQPQPQAEPQSQPLTSAWLRAHFDSLPFPARMGALARYGRALAPDAYAALHAALDAGDPDERHTALFLAVVRRDIDTVSRALADPLLRRRALSAALRLPLHEQALAALALHDTRAVRHETYRVLKTARRTALADSLIQQVYERHGGQEAARLLTACSAQTAAHWLPHLEPPAGVLNSLARTAPVAVARHLTDEYAARRSHERHSYARAHRIIATAVAERDTEAGLLMLRGAPSLIGKRAAVALLRTPSAVLEILRAAPTHYGTEHDGTEPVLTIQAGPLPPSVKRAALDLPPDDLVELATRCPADAPRRIGTGQGKVAPDSLLRLLPPAERCRVVRERIGGDFGRRASLSAIAALEPDDRSAFLAPWLKRSAGRSRTLRRFAGLPLDVAEPVLRAQTSDHRMHLRLAAWPALLASAELNGDPQEYARIAASCERAWHDQNDVRRFALAQLAAAPARLLAAVEERVLRDAALTTVQSRDSTAATLACAERWLRRTTESAAARGNTERAAFAARLLCQVLADPRRRGPRNPLRLDAPTARAVCSGTVAESGAHAETLTSLAELLAPHLAELPTLEALMRRTAEEHEDPEIAARAAAVWIAPAATREARCAELVRLDPSFAAVPEVLRTLTTRRTDLLDDVLEAAVRDGLRGRIRPRGTPWAPRLRPADTGRWLAYQRREWAAYLVTVASDEHAPLRERTDAAALLNTPAHLTALVSAAPQPVAAAAIGALGGTRPVTAELLETLLRHAGTGGVRGRAAMSAVRRLLDDVPDSRAITLLAPLLRNPANPVGTRKEAARALGILTGTAALSALLAAWDEPGQHRDVRAVIAPLLLRGIDRDDIAHRLSEGVREQAVREAVVGIRPTAVPRAARAAYNAFLLGLVQGGDDSTAIAACRALHAHLTDDASEEAARVLAQTAADLTRTRPVWHAAVAQLVALPSGENTSAITTEAFAPLRIGAHSDEPDSRVDVLRRLDGCADVIAGQYSHGASRAVVDVLLDALEGAGLSRQAARLAQEAALDAARAGDPALELWERLLGLVEARPDRLALDDGLYIDVGRPGRPDCAAAVLDAVRLLRARGSAPAGLLALALVSAAGRSASWREPWPGELAALRDHPDPDTALGALVAGPTGGD
ncbi:hypothetical protein J7I98_18450 [Streptomyces sp. ISL-98]|uniref:hypothetical protein n=1 Tax=Streptomyces sp. ISL-98 TaxID=2819192 RepID=UPI001BE76445|nr:hypothetical protein [Streptomyces sp. ISL-98]MBT2507827.1 hypothetical protein [Streptomyces sp. ISL-98]